MLVGNLLKYIFKDFQRRWRKNTFENRSFLEQVFGEYF